MSLLKLESPSQKSGRQGRWIQRLDIYVEVWCNLSDVVAALENQVWSVAGILTGTGTVVVVKTLQSELLALCQLGT